MKFISGIARNTSKPWIVSENNGSSALFKLAMEL